MKVGVVGAGLAGATSAYTLVMAGVGSEIVLVDKNKNRAEAEANDILHAVAHIVDIIADDHRAILTVAARTEQIAGVQDVTVSLPRLLGGEGILATFPLPLNSAESEALERSAGVVRIAIDQLGIAHGS